MKPTCQESAEIAMYRPISLWSARSATSGGWTAPCRHSATPKSATANASSANAAAPESQSPLTGTSSHEAAQPTPTSARNVIRR